MTTSRFHDELMTLPQDLCAELAAVSIPDAPEGTGQAARALQQTALRDLVVLSTESATTEAKIEAARAQALEAAAKEFDKATFGAREKFRAMEEQVRKRHAARVAGVESTHSQAIAKIESDFRTGMHTIEAESEPIVRKLKERLDHDIWLADSVYDVAQNQFRAEAKKSAEEYQARLKELAGLKEKAVAQLAEYGQPVAAAGDDAGEGETADSELGAGGDATATAPARDYAAVRQEAEQHLSRLGGLFVPSLMSGSIPYVVMVFLVALAGAAGHFIFGGRETPQWPAIGVGAAVMLPITLFLGMALRKMARVQVRAAYQPLLDSLAAGRRSAKSELDASERAREMEKTKALHRRDKEVKAINDRMTPLVHKAAGKREAAVATLKSNRDTERTRLDTEHEQVLAKTEDWLRRHLADVTAKKKVELRAAQTQFDARQQQCRGEYDQARAALERRLSEGLKNIRVPYQAQAAEGNGDAHAAMCLPAPLSWDDPAWENWSPPAVFAPMVRFGEMLVDLQKIAAKSGGSSGAAEPDRPRLKLPAAFTVPANLAFPQGASLLIQTDRDGRDDAIRALQMTMARLLTWLPAGRVRFIIIDPVGLGQTFAGFMHLADYDDALIGGRTWTETEQIDKRLADLTEHMETVIQKYLRNEFATIDDYNTQAGELAEPYRFLVLADFPAGFSTEALRRLSSIAVSGPRCGVYTLVIRDTRFMSDGTHMDELEKSSVNLVRQYIPVSDEENAPAVPRFVWQDPIFRQFPLTLDPPPNEEQLTRIAHIVGQGAKEANRVEVDFDSIAPTPEQFWTMSSADELQVAVGRRGATRLQMLRLGRGVAQHVLIAGKTGSGKSTLLHALVTNLAMWYSPDEVEFYLIDFKKGVEFKTYASQRLPHARAIAVESDREFGLSVLQRLDAELTRRGDIYRRASVQDLAAYRQTPGAMPMPRTLLLIDEFQEFFSEDDKLAQEASLLLDRLVRQGRAFGIHVLLGSQTIGGTSGLNRSTIGQMAVRVALQTSEADSQIILGDGNSAARLLTRPGEAIYNDQGGLVEANSPFQVAWLPDERREQYLMRVRAKTDALAGKLAPRDEPVVFEGNAAADLSRNPQLQELIDAGSWPAAGSIGTPRAWVGDPVAIKDATSITFRRQSGSNLLIIGQQDESALAIFAAAMLSLAAQQSPKDARFYVLDGSSADSMFVGVLDSVRTSLPHPGQTVEYRAVPEVMEELAKEVKRRQTEGQESQPGSAAQSADPEIYVLIYALQRYRALRKAEDSFGSSFSLGSDEEKKPDPGVLFADLLRDGPPVGIHVLAWCDTPIAVERALDRGSLREFDNRILFQMSASDSSNLIDSPLANKLGFHRALAYSEEQGTVEKFRPYGLPPKAWLNAVKEKLEGRRVG